MYQDITIILRQNHDDASNKFVIIAIIILIKIIITSDSGDLGAGYQADSGHIVLQEHNRSLPLQQQNIRNTGEKKRVHRIILRLGGGWGGGRG